MKDTTRTLIILSVLLQTWRVNHRRERVMR